nr:MAG TPA: hypothetical protein [Caudoviricetes sp.]
MDIFSPPFNAIIAQGGEKFKEEIYYMIKGAALVAHSR